MVETAAPIGIEEKRKLKIGYFATFTERWPINENIADCSSKESAYLWYLEKHHLVAPEQLRFDKLKNDIAPEHRGHLELQWQKVSEKWLALDRATIGLKRKWHISKELKPERDAVDAVRSSKIKVRRDLRRVLQTIVSQSGDEHVELLPIDPNFWQLHDFDPGYDLRTWQEDEKNARDAFKKAHKNYIVALRSYYEMILFKPGPKYAKPDVEYTPKVLALSEDHPLRDTIKIENRYLKLIDIFHQAYAGARSAHHEQPTGRLRKDGETPYSEHIKRSLLKLVFDTIPFTITSEKFVFDFVVALAAEAIHDIPEDTRLTPTGALGFVQRLANFTDSTLKQTFDTGFTIVDSTSPVSKPYLDPDEIETRILNPITDAVRTELFRILRPMTKDTPFTNDEVKLALKEALAGITTPDIIGLAATDPRRTDWLPHQYLPRKVVRGKKVKGERIPKQPQSATFRRFSESFQPKQDRFLIAARSMTRGQTQAMTLRVKAEEKDDNTLKLGVLSLEKQLATLRDNVGRFIGYLVLDHDKEEYPLHNILPRLIHDTLQMYKQFVKRHPNMIQNLDSERIKILEQWAREYPIQQVPGEAALAVDDYNAALAARRKKRAA